MLDSGKEKDKEDVYKAKASAKSAIAWINTTEGKEKLESAFQTVLSSTTVITQSQHISRQLLYEPFTV